MGSIPPATRMAMVEEIIEIATAKSTFDAYMAFRAANQIPTSLSMARQALVLIGFCHVISKLIK